MDERELLGLASTAGAVLYTEPELTGTKVVAVSFIGNTLKRFAALVVASEREACAKLAEEFGPNRPILSNQKSERALGRWEGEQAASSNISKLIRDTGKSLP